MDKNIILRQLSEPYASILSPVDFTGLEEIRFRVNRPISLYYHRQNCLLPNVVVSEDIEALAAALCNHSVYAYLNDLKDGFITIRGGHRVGLAGKCVKKDGQITGITAISGINLRIARQFPGCAAKLAHHLKTSTGIKNTLLISPPQCGKTTYLRDLARIFSVENKVTIIDERSEIAGTYEGMPQFDVGPQTDVLDRFPKATGMLMALRSLSPQILITDELGGMDDIEAIHQISGAGCRIIASVHGDDLTELKLCKNDLLSFFDVAVMMGRQNGLPAILSIQNLR